MITDIEHLIRESLLHIGYIFNANKVTINVEKEEDILELLKNDNINKSLVKKGNKYVSLNNFIEITWQ